MSRSRLNALARFAALPPAERATVLSAIASIVFSIVVVRTGGLRVALRLLQRAGLGSSRPASGPARVGVVTHATADALPVHSSCLERSVALSWLLLRRGHRCALVVESQFDTAGFGAHAWVDTLEGGIGQPRGGDATEIARWNLPRHR